MTRTLLLLLAALLLPLGACGDDEAQDNGPCQGFGCTPDDNNQGNHATNNADALPWRDQDTTVAWTSLEDRPCPEDNSLTWDNFGGPDPTARFYLGQWLACGAP